MILSTVAVFLAVVLVVAFIWMATTLRVIVPTNAVHIVQSAKHTISYGKDQPAGNTYYRWPAFVPRLGISVIILPVSVFKEELLGYEGYDKERVPFMLDAVAFFRITDSNVAAQRVKSFDEMQGQLTFILKGAIRSILATADIQTILESRAVFGKKFTEEVDEQLMQWGVQTVKMIELMDIHDAQGSQAIANIMAKRQAAIQMDSRVSVAASMQAASIAEVDAKRAVEVQQQVAAESVGIRTAEQAKNVGIAHEQAKQEIATEAAKTASKNMEVRQVEQVREAEILRDVQVVEANRDNTTAIIDAERDKKKVVLEAEGEANAQAARADGAKRARVLEAEANKQMAVLTADGTLATMTKTAEGIRAEGLAKADAEQALQMAPVTAQITLAKEIGANESYQQYLITIRQIEAAQAVGVEQAGALSKAEVKVISTIGRPGDALTGVQDLFTAAGGTSIGGMMEALKNTPTGAALVAKLTESKPAPSAARNGAAKA